MTLAFTLFIAGMLTILLPCILPLIPIVLGVSVAGRSKWRPLLTVLGMIVSFVGFTFLLQVVLSRFILLADLMRIATFDVLLIFGVCFLTGNRWIRYAGAIVGALFFWIKGIDVVVGFAFLGILAVELGGWIAPRIQQLGANVQQSTREEFGQDSPFTAFVIGLTLGLVWVPCAGPALGFALTLVRDEPSALAALYLFAYGLGTGVPLLAIGYGGQAAVHSVRSISRYSGRIKQVSGILLILSAIALHFNLFTRLQIWLLDNTSFGDVGTRIEESLFGEDMEESMFDMPDSSLRLNMKLPTISRAPEFTGLGQWFNSEPLTLESLKGKVVLIDFWTYSCINCIRTLPHIQGYWEKYGGGELKIEDGEIKNDFVLIGIHAPEFVFEKDPKNVEAAIKRYGLTYPVAQDNDFGTWRAFANRFWPAKYLIDANGYIRYEHFGEGAYEETDDAIASLLEEIGVVMEDSSDFAPAGASSDKEGGRKSQSPETYLGERSWLSLINAQGEPTDQTVTYEAPVSVPLHKYALVGDWQMMDGERQVLMSDEGEIRMNWLGGEVNLVLGPDQATGPVTADVMMDGKLVKTITIDQYDLYNLFTGEYGEHELVLKIKGKGAAGYAFTFGQ